MGEQLRVMSMNYRLIISAAIGMCLMSACSENVSLPEAAETLRQSTEISSDLVTVGTEEYRGFIIDNVFHSESNGDILFAYDEQIMGWLFGKQTSS